MNAQQGESSLAATLAGGGPTAPATRLSTVALRSFAQHTHVAAATQLFWKNFEWLCRRDVGQAGWALELGCVLRTLSWSFSARTLELANRECESGAALCAVVCEPPLADDTVRYFMDMRMTDDDGSSAARVGIGEPAICTAATGSRGFRTDACLRRASRGCS